MEIEYLSLKHGSENILRLTKRMLEQAQNNAWDGMCKIERDRGVALNALFDHPDIELYLPHLATVLHEVLELDRECIQLTESARFALLKNLHHQSKSDYVSSIYLTNSLG